MKKHLRVFSEGSCVCVTPGDESLHRQQEGICVKVLQQVEVVRHLDTIPHRLSVLRSTITVKGPKQSTPRE